MVIEESSHYVDRVNRAIDYVTRHLDHPLRLGDVARVACFSPYHFHRVFQMMAGETLAAFVKRVRLERAIYLMSHQRGISLTEAAHRCGFSSSSDFSRSFRAHFGVPPRMFDVERFRATRREQMQLTLTGPDERHRLRGLPPGENPDGLQARLVDLPPRRVAYLRVAKPYTTDGVPKATERLVSWARSRYLAAGQWLGYQWDDPEIVPLEKCRYDIGLVIPEDAPVDDDVCETRFEAMRVAEVDVVGSIDREMRALDWLYKTWLPQSGFVPDHQPCFEAWNSEPFAHGAHHVQLRVQLPIVPATKVPK